MLKNSLIFLSLSLITVQANWSEALGNVAKEVVNSKLSSSSSQSIQNSENNKSIESGLRDALSFGVKEAVKTIGKEDGFLKNDLVKINMPGALGALEKGAKAVGQEKIVEDLVISMNRAAEKAVPKAVDIFAEQIKNMSIDDAKKLLFSEDKKALTKYFETHTKSPLSSAFLPIIKSSMAEVEVLKYYNLLKSLVPMPQNELIKGIGGALGMGANFDIDEYVLNKSLEGLFTMVSKEEEKIRANPIYTKTESIQNIFGLLSK